MNSWYVWGDEGMLEEDLTEEEMKKKVDEYQEQGREDVYGEDEDGEFYEGN